MRLTPATLMDVAAIVKANLSGWYILLALLLFSIFMSGCDNSEDKIDGCFPVRDCVFEATAVKVTCGYGAFDDTWLQVNDTTYIQPWVNATTLQHLIVGQTYRFGYVEVARDNRYKDLYTCQAALPKAKVVKLTCLEQIVSTSI
ncbi:hypothetical protein [Pontibacter pudoricolor]|uniref:hypothetical protein n=1 Tax=Pontibacter pudoricolor TaxID=2694930 RepID=UPI001392037B|nr:hypothetical protein [Pontibacter pudoricolor]